VYRTEENDWLGGVCRLVRRVPRRQPVNNGRVITSNRYRWPGPHANAGNIRNEAQPWKQVKILVLIARERPRWNDLIQHDRSARRRWNGSE
jgi:hypothetical protein